MIQIRNNITRQNAEIDEQDLRNLELTYSFRFPEDVKQFYLKYNGGQLEKCFYVLPDDTFVFQSFYSVKTGRSTLNEKMRLNYTDDWWPKELIPFGYDGGGNSFCFHAGNGQIYYVYEDDFDDDGKVLIKYLARDFISFINNMDEEG